MPDFIGRLRIAPIPVIVRALVPVVALATAWLTPPPAHAETIGEVDTVFKLLGPDHKIVVDAHDDPLVQGVTCYVSRAKTGGVKGALGLAEDRSESSVDCRQTGPLVIKGKLPQQEEVFSERTSLVFKRLRLVRMVDTARRSLVYLSYSDRLIEGSPNNSISVVPLDPPSK